MKITCETWLRKAVDELNTAVFGGDLDTLNHAYQISWGRCRGKKHSETIQPSDVEDLEFGRFFPTTISIDYTMGDTYNILLHLTYECVKGFFNVSKGKALKRELEKYYFEEPWKEPTPSPYLRDLLNEVKQTMESKYGVFPNLAVVFPVKESKGQGSSHKIFCPECGMELTMSNKIYKKFNGAMPTCVCGAKFAEAKEETDEENLGE